MGLLVGLGRWVSKEFKGSACVGAHFLQFNRDGIHVPCSLHHKMKHGDVNGLSKRWAEIEQGYILFLDCVLRCLTSIFCFSYRIPDTGKSKSMVLACSLKWVSPAACIHGGEQRGKRTHAEETEPKRWTCLITTVFLYKGFDPFMTSASMTPIPLPKLCLQHWI
jgi:hypothetical protein